MATQRNYLILRDQTQSSAVLGCAADHQGKSQAIDFQCCIFAPFKGVKEWLLKSAGAPRTNGKSQKDLPL
jgi:hypothetical protein